MPAVMDATGIGRCTQASIVRVGGMFTRSPNMVTAATAKGLTAGVLCVRGRVGAAGVDDPHEAARLLGLIAPRLVGLAWRRSTGLSAGGAAAVYASVCAQWGREHLSGIADPDAIAAQAEKVVDSADLSDLPLAAAWRAWLRPQEPGARIAHALMLLRELRHGFYLAALRAHRLEMPVALLAYDGGAGRLGRLGWRMAEIDAARRRAPGMVDLAELRDAVENSTDVAVSSCLNVLDVPAQRVLIDGLARADQVTRDAENG